MLGRETYLKRSKEGLIFTQLIFKYQILLHGLAVVPVARKKIKLL